MAATKARTTTPRTCPHRDYVLIAYLTGYPERQGHASAVWCPDCGALGHIQATRKEATWKLPGPSRK